MYVWLILIAGEMEEMLFFIRRMFYPRQATTASVRSVKKTTSALLQVTYRFMRAILT